MYTKDETGTIKCPYCSGSDDLHYDELYEARIHWESALYPQHEDVGTLMNYQCRNCDFEWIVPLSAHQRFTRLVESANAI